MTQEQGSSSDADTPRGGRDVADEDRESRVQTTGAAEVSDTGAMPGMTSENTHAGRPDAAGRGGTGTAAHE